MNEKQTFTPDQLPANRILICDDDSVVISVFVAGKAYWRRLEVPGGAPARDGNVFSGVLSGFVGRL